jgi:hypothetical protein
MQKDQAATTGCCAPSQGRHTPFQAQTRPMHQLPCLFRPSTQQRGPAAAESAGELRAQGLFRRGQITNPANLRSLFRRHGHGHGQAPGRRRFSTDNPDAMRRFGLRSTVRMSAMNGENGLIKGAGVVTSSAEIFL